MIPLEDAGDLQHLLRTKTRAGRRLPARRRPIADMAYAATGLLIDLLMGGSPPQLTWLQFTMQRRGSTAPPHA
jgi:DNA-binding LacI/PurR family transcriptional regulator